MSSFNRAKAASIPITQDIDWKAAYDELLPKVYHYFCLRTGDPLEAEDLTATTFERAWRDRERYRKDLGSFSQWLFGIARHLVITHYRRTQQEHPIESAGTDANSRPTEEAATYQQDFERISSILALLPDREREIFSLKYGAQFTNRSIAKAVGITETNVGTILNRIVRQLREQLEKENE